MLIDKIFGETLGNLKAEAVDKMDLAAVEELRPYIRDFVRMSQEPSPLSDPRDIDKILKHMAVKYIALRLVLKYGYPKD